MARPPFRVFCERDNYITHLRVLNSGDVQGKTFPNPCVGCVLVKDGEVVGEGFHPKAGLPHAEVMCVNAHFHIHWSIRDANIDTDVCMRRLHARKINRWCDFESPTLKKCADLCPVHGTGSRGRCYCIRDP